jgi:hypothetical protein
MKETLHLLLEKQMLKDELKKKNQFEKSTKKPYLSRHAKFVT